MFKKLILILAAAAFCAAAVPTAKAQATGGPVVTYGGQSQFLTPSGLCYLSTDGSDVVIVTSTTGLPTAVAQYAYITADGTNSVSAHVANRVLIGTAGSADSALLLEDGTTAIAKISTASVLSLSLDALLTTGTLTAVTTGTTAGKVTLLYR